jgi:hypothetical protein
MTKTLREKYVANEILRIGDIVEDTSTGESLKIIDRGSNYITVDGPTGVSKKWLNEVKVEPEVEEKEQDFTLTETGQIKLFGYETVGFDASLSEFIIEQFKEFDDMYAKHQIVKLLDSAIVETNYDRKYDLLEKVSSFYTTHNIDEPMLVEAMKNELERKRIVEILATVAGSAVDKSVYTTAKNAVTALKEKYIKRAQWEVLWPFLKMASAAGISGIMQNLPFNLDTQDKLEPKTGTVHEDYDVYDEIAEILEDNLDELIDSLDEEDLIEAFEDEVSDEFLSEEQLNEVLSLNSRIRLGRDMKMRKGALKVARARALTRGASTSVLMGRARKLAETLVKRRIFRKAAADMTRQEKERFEKGSFRRRALIARLAQRLFSKVRAAQTTRQHAHAAGQPANPGTPVHNNNTAQTGAS